MNGLSGHSTGTVSVLGFYIFFAAGFGFVLQAGQDMGGGEGVFVFCCCCFLFFKGVFGGTNSAPEFLGYNVKTNTYNLLVA